MPSISILTTIYYNGVALTYVQVRLNSKSMAFYPISPIIVTRYPSMGWRKAAGTEKTVYCTLYYSSSPGCQGNNVFAKSVGAEPGPSFPPSGLFLSFLAFLLRSAVRLGQVLANYALVVIGRIGERKKIESGDRLSSCPFTNKEDVSQRGAPSQSSTLSHAE